MQNKVVLVVEDEVQICNFICYILKQEGFDHCIAGKGADALRELRMKKIDLILLDLGLPDMDGIEIITKIRKESDLPIIVVSARDQEQGKAEALDLGADDYVTKPFFATELSARIRVAFRHSARIESSQRQKYYKIGNLELNVEKHLVFLEQKELHVTPLEYKLLHLFFQNMGKVLTTQFIIKEIYGISYGRDTQALRALVAGLRRKLEKNPGKPRYIITEMGVGYRMADE